MSGIKDELKDYVNWAVGITFFVSALLFSKDDLLALFSVNPFHAALSAVLLLTTVCWFFQYLSAVRHELELLDSSFDSEEIRKISGLVLPTAVGLSVFFGSLVALSQNILAYAGLAALLSSFDLYGQATTIRNVNIFIADRKFNGSVGEEEAQILFDYYIKKPLLSRISIMLVSFCASFTLASYAKFLSNEPLCYVAYVVVILVIIVGETVMRKWRHERDCRLIELHDSIQNEDAGSES